MNGTVRTRPISILLVEDNAADAELAVRALRQGKIRNEVRIARDGDAALRLLGLRGAPATGPPPDLILLDLNLPGMDGRAVLEQVKGDEALRRIPVVVLTGSLVDGDVVQSYRVHANAYVAKPIDPGKFLAVISSIERFWLQVVKLPGQ